MVATTVSFFRSTFGLSTSEEDYVSHFDTAKWCIRGQNSTKISTQGHHFSPNSI